MPATKSEAKKTVAKRKERSSPRERLQKALEKRTKADLIETLLVLAGDDNKILRQLELRFDVRAPFDDLVSTRQAITDATAVDERRINYNFDYDHGAYRTVERNLGRLVEMSAFDEAMGLSLELMRRGNYQIEMSDEGMMTEEVEACLNVVVSALLEADLKSEVVASWCDAMIQADRVKFICEKELKALRKRVVR
jgi:hypothetical protein